MQILELRLSAFGRFTDEVLDFSQGRPGLHLVMGPNEAGKSTALRALKQALFKIPTRSTDDFVHPHAKLRVGLKLRAADGREISLVRRKGNANTLLDPDENVVAESVLSPLLNGLSEDAFSQRFALDHKELVKGGRSIVDGKGELGELLFQAAGGVANLLETRKRMRSELEELYKPNASKPRINALLRELKQARELARERSLPSSRWLEHDGARSRAEADLGRIDEELAAARATRHRYQRLHDAIPLFNQRRDLRITWDELKAVPILEESFSDRRAGLDAERIRARADHAAAALALSEIETGLQDLLVPDALLADSERVEQLRESLADFRKLVKSLPRERESVRLQELEVRRMLRELGTEESADWLAAARSVKLARSAKNTIKALGREQVDRGAERAELIPRLHEYEDRLTRLRGRRDNLGAPISTESLAAAVAEANRRGDLEKLETETGSRLERLIADATAAVARLPLWKGSLEALAVLPAPSGPTVERFEADHAATRARFAALRDRRDQARRKESEAQTELERLRLAVGVLPDENNLIEARSRRDAVWLELRAAWTEKSSAAKRKDQETAKLADDYEQAVKNADAMADRLRREAGRMAEQAAVQAGFGQAHRELVTLEVELTEAAASQAALDAEWSALWAPLGVAPPPPREMQVWLNERRELLRLNDEIRDQRDQNGLLEITRARIADDLTRNLHAVGETGDFTDETVNALKRRADKAIKRIEKASTERIGLDQTIAELEIQLETARGRLRAIDDEITGWRENWARAVAPLGLGAEATVDQADAAIEQVDALTNELKNLESARIRVEGLERDRDRFLRVLGEPPPPDGSVDLEAASTRARDLIKDYDAALILNQRRDGLIEQRDQQQAKLKAARVALEGLVPRFADLCREARVDDDAQLPKAERQSREARTVRGRIAELEERLAKLAGHETVDAFQESARALDVDRIPDQIRELDRDVADLEARRDELHQILGRERTLLEAMNGDDAGAESAQRAEALAAELAAAAENYARLQLASRVLDQVVERYRVKHQGPVLGRAGEFFSRLTLGAFTGLRGEVEDDGRHVLRAIRAEGGDPVAVDGLSEGTADQLYLALRLASLEVALESRPPLPLLLDDVLIQFDDARALAALAVLAEASTRTQVVLFTHHEHLVELAKSAVNPQTLYIHRLS